MAARGGERIKHRRRAAEEDVPVAAHEVNDDVSYQDEQIDTLFRVFQTQEVEIRALIFRSREPDKIKVFRVEVHTLPEAFGEQLRQLSCPDHRELVIGPRRVQDEYLLRAVGFLRVRRRGEDARRERDRRQRPTPNVTSQGQHMPATSELCFDGNPEEARRQDGIGPRPRCARDERIVVGKARARVQRVVDVERNHRSRPAVPQDFGHADVQLVDAISIASYRAPPDSP